MSYQGIGRHNTENSCDTRKVECQNQKQVREKLQMRFAHYLRSTRLDSNNAQLEMSQTALAQILECSSSLIPKLESSYPYPRLYKSVEYLEKFAKLQDLSLADFCSILDGTRVEKKTSWHSNLFSKFSSSITLKNLRHLEKLLKKYEDNFAGFNELFRMMVVISKLDKDDKKVVTTFLQRIEK